MQEHKFLDFSLTTLRFPDFSRFSRFSRWVATLDVSLEAHNKALPKHMIQNHTPQTTWLIEYFCGTLTYCAWYKTVYSLSATNTPDTSARNFYKKLGQVSCMEFWARYAISYIYKLAVKLHSIWCQKLVQEKTCTAQESMSVLQVSSAVWPLHFLHKFLRCVSGIYRVVQKKWYSSFNFAITSVNIHRF